jgi:hypothetical protein
MVDAYLLLGNVEMAELKNKKHSRRYCAVAGLIKS